MSEIGKKSKKLAPVLAMSNQKGGVGKTTITLQAAFYSARKKLKVLVIDFDHQGNTSKRIAAGREYYGSSTPDLFKASTKNVSPMTGQLDIDLIWADNEDPQMARLEHVKESQVLHPAKYISSLREDYDVIFLDCPPALGRKLTAALLAATHAIIPVEVAGFALDGLGDLLTTLTEIQQGLNDHLEIAGIVINKIDYKRSVAVEVAEKIREELGELVFQSELRMRNAFDTANLMSVPIWTLKNGAARMAAKEMASLTNEIHKRCGVAV